MNKLEKQYQNLVEVLINECDISSIDREIEESNLYFGKSKHYEKGQLNSNYVRILNHFDLKLLTSEEKARIGKVLSIDEIRELVQHTIDRTTNKNYLMEPLTVTIPKNTIVLEILVGPNTKELRGQAFMNYLKQQEKFLNTLKKKYTRQLTHQLKYPVIIYDNKDV